jgi:hypothetical protein
MWGRLFADMLFVKGSNNPHKLARRLRRGKEGMAFDDTSYQAVSERIRNPETEKAKCGTWSRFGGGTAPGKIRRGAIRNGRSGAVQEATVEAAMHGSSRRSRSAPVSGVGA